MSQPIVKNPGVVLNFPAVWERDIFAFLMNPVICSSTETEAGFLLQQRNKIGDERSSAEGFGEFLGEFSFR